MAGSFGIFRQYEKAALAGLAIMAMLAFFVLPPILQMGAGAAGPDPLVVSWSPGERPPAGGGAPQGDESVPRRVACGLGAGSVADAARRR
jgi:hypothetical protein